MAKGGVISYLMEYYELGMISAQISVAFYCLARSHQPRAASCTDYSAWSMEERIDLPCPASIDSYLLPVRASLVISLPSTDDNASSLLGARGLWRSK